MTKKEQIALLKQGIIEKQKEKRLVEQVLARVQTIISTDELYRGKQGEPGEKPAYRVDYLTPDELEALKAELKPADGLPGKDGKDANTQDIIKELLANEVFLLYTKAKNPPTAGQVARELIDNETFLDKVKGEKGDKGDIPNHEWKGTKLRFEKPNGGWGKWVDLKGFTAVVQQSGSGSGSTTGGTFALISDIPVIPKTQIGLTIDGGGSAITTGLKGFGRVPRTGTISGWTILADQVGDIVVDVQLSSFAGFPTTASIAGTEKPTLSTAQSNEDIALTTWTTAVTEGDIISYTVDSVATVTRVNLFIHIT